LFFSRLRQVDLAGSERGSKTGASGNTAKEGAFINKSLSALGDVIKALEQRALDKPGGKIHIPYRNSTLTKLLSDSLGGNSKTIMIAACGPAASNIEETTGTMRFAARVKAVKNKPKINEDPKDAKMREMGDEISKLRKMNEELKRLGSSGGVDPTKLANANLKGVAGQMKYFMAKKKLEKKEAEVADKINGLESQVQDMEDRYGNKCDELEKLAEERSKDQRTFNDLREEAAKALAAAEARIDALTQDLAKAWQKTGEASGKSGYTTGMVRLSHLTDRWKSRVCRRCLQKWAELCVEDYCVKVYPAQLGPFGSVATTLSASMVLSLDAASGMYTYEVSMASSNALQEVQERFKDSVMNLGQTSPPHAIAMSEQGRRFAKVPPAAAHVRWAYPLVGMAEASVKHALDADHPDLMFAVRGGFVYTDAAGAVIHAATIDGGNDIYFQPPKQWRPEFTATLVL
jgi:hypothetical protein